MSVKTDHRCGFGSIRLLEGDCGFALFLWIINGGDPAIRRVKMCSSEVQGLLTFRRSCKRRDGLNDDDRNDVYDNIPEEVLQLGLGSGGRDA